MTTFPKATLILAILCSAAMADGIYPHGDKLPFMGYSGDPSRDLTNGFTVAGPVYGNQMPYLQRCFSNGWPVVAHIGPRITFKDDKPDKYKLDEPSLRAQVEQQMKELAPHKEIVWWAVTPEELRPWRKEEMKYLEIVCATIRKNDPQQRPIFHYNPNHSDAKRLETFARHVDVIAKGCYVNLSGKKRDRAWVRWSVEQELAVRPKALALVMPELIHDPEPGEEGEIRSWVRHDVYLGLASGAKGVCIFSLFKRKEVKRTWQLWYDAYAECARELNGPRALAQVFLFGERRTDIKVDLVKGGGPATVQLGGGVEAVTTSDRERTERQIKMPSWTAAEFLHKGSRYLFLINSANSAATFRLATNNRMENVFDSTRLTLDGGNLMLSAYGVAGVRLVQ
jgi:hypothetical protein